MSQKPSDSEIQQSAGSATSGSVAKASSEADNAQESISNSPATNGGSASLRPRTPGTRDLSVSALVHLMGIPSSAELQALETKIDVIASKMSRVISQVERVESSISQFTNELYLDRIDFQLADLRTVIKKVFAEAMGNNQISFEVDTLEQTAQQFAAADSEREAVVLSSEDDES